MIKFEQAGIVFQPISSVLRAPLMSPFWDQTSTDGILKRCSEGIGKMHKEHFEPGLVRFMVEGAAFESARSLTLLRAIEHTNKVNTVLADIFERIAREAAEATKQVCAHDIVEAEKPIDSDETVRASIESAMDNCSRLVDALRLQRNAAMADERLHHSDEVVACLERTIAAVADAHDGLNELNWAVMEHDADISPIVPKGPFTSVDDLFASMGIE